MTASELFEQEANVLFAIFPNLSIKRAPGGRPYLKGFLELKDDTDNVIDNFSIEIYPTPQYPYRYPMIFEVGGKIPRNINWHVFEGIGNCCLGALPQEIGKCAKGITLLWFIEEIVVNYFYAQIFKRENGYFLQERSHGLTGDFEFYWEVFNTGDLKRILKYLQYIKNNPQPDRTSSCFCGSGVKYRKCHKTAYSMFSNIRDIEFNILIERLINSEQFKQQYPLDFLRFKGMNIFEESY